MAARDITDLGTIRGAAQQTQGVVDPDLQSCLTAASLWIETMTGRRWKSADYNQWHSGSRATRYSTNAEFVECATLWLADPETGLATLPVSGIGSVTENGTALTSVRLQTATSIPTSGELAIIDDTRGTIVRASGAAAGFSPKAWQAGNANVRVVCTAGYLDADMPAEIVRACIELTWLMYNEGRRTGIDQMAAAGMDVRFIRFLSPNTKKILEMHSRRRSPRTLEG